MFAFSGFSMTLYLILEELYIFVNNHFSSSTFQNDAWNNYIACCKCKTFYDQTLVFLLSTVIV